MHFDNQSVNQRYSKLTFKLPTTLYKSMHIITMKMNELKIDIGYQIEQHCILKRFLRALRFSRFTVIRTFKPQNLNAKDVDVLLYEELYNQNNLY